MRGADGALWQRTRPPAGEWGDWHSLGGDHLDLTVVETDDYLQVFTVGACRGVWRIQHGEHGWGDWLRLGGDHLARLAVARTTGKALTVVAIDQDGMLHRYG